MYIYIYIYHIISRRSNHMSCQLDRLWPPTWLESRLISGRFHNSDSKTAPTGLTWLPWPLWLARLRRLWAFWVWLLNSSSSNLVVQMGKSINSTAEGYQNHKITLFQQKSSKMPPAAAKVSSNLFPRPPQQALQCPKVLPKVPLGSKFCNIFATCCMTWAMIFQGCFWHPTLGPKRSSGHPKIVKFTQKLFCNLRTSVSATGPGHARRVRSTLLYDD